MHVLHTHSKIVMDEDIKTPEICLKWTQEDKSGWGCRHRGKRPWCREWAGGDKSTDKETIWNLLLCPAERWQWPRLGQWGKVEELEMYLGGGLEEPQVTSHFPVWLTESKTGKLGDECREGQVGGNWTSVDIFHLLTLRFLWQTHEYAK